MVIRLISSSFLDNLKHNEFVASNKGFYNSNTFHFSHFCKTLIRK